MYYMLNLQGVPGSGKFMEQTPTPLGRFVSLRFLVWYKGVPVAERTFLM